MQIQRLRLVNFRQHEDTELVLGAGLTGIIGPNGAGKSTILEALAWAIYGMPAARGSRDSIRRRGAPARSPVRVELEFTLGAHHYRVVRTLNNAELYQDQSPAPVVITLGAVTDRLTRILGMSREEFFNTYFTSQKELAVMASMTAGERAQFLSRVLGYEKLRDAQDCLKERRTALKARLQLLESTLADTAELEADEGAARARIEAARQQEKQGEKRLREATAQVESLRPRLEAMQRLKQAVAELNGELKLADHKVTEARDRHEQLDRQLAEALAARDRLEPLVKQLAPLQALKAEAEQLEALERSMAARKGYEAQLKDLQARAAAIRERVAASPTPEQVAQRDRELEAARTDRAALHAQIEERRTAWVRDLQDAKTKRQGLLDQYQDIQEQRQRIIELGPEGVCPTCTRPLGEEFANVVGVLERQLQEVTDNGTFYKKRIDQLSRTPAEITRGEKDLARTDREIQKRTEELARLRAQAAESVALSTELRKLERKIKELERELADSATPYDAKRHAEVRREVNRLEATNIQVVQLRVLADRAEDLVKEAETAEKVLTEREAQARALRERMETLGYREADYGELLAQVELAEQSRREAELNLIRARAERTGAEQSLAMIARRRAERERREQEAKAVSADLALNAEVDRALTDLRTELNATLRPDLSDSASTFLRDMTAGRYTELELDESYSALILEDGEPKPVISGGEEDLVNLSLRLAISQMIAERAGQPLSLLVLDEIFGSLDEDRRASVLDLLRGLADRFPQVILITHIESVREGFDRVIRIAFDQNRGAARARDDTGGNSGLAA